MNDNEPTRLLPVSVWITAQQTSRAQRKDRYLSEATKHPARMLPAIAAHAIGRYTKPGDIVVDPMCGIGTTLVEAAYLDRRAVGIELEPAWAEIARANIAHATGRGAAGSGQVFTGDATMLTELVPEELFGQASLVLTSPPYGPGVHGQVDAVPGGGVQKRHDRYSDSRDRRNLAHAGWHGLTEGFSQILAGCAVLLKPGGYVAVTARPWRANGSLVDLPSAVVACGIAAGLEPVERCVALLAGVREGRLIGRASFFQLHSVRKAIGAGVPQALIGHEDVVVFRRPRTSKSSSAGRS
ncbi:DNA methyltransferase [Catellatospora citrea]|uniref:TRM11 family SAM-dependent methyltransferase n=1 Tax=Catellatospora citrea TaxID=53366 RepID=UPI0034091EB4